MTMLEDYDAIAHLADELSWVEARCRRLIAEREAREEGAPGRRPRLARPTAADCCIEAFQEEETLTREHIDELLEARRLGDTPLPLDKLCEDHALGDVERVIVLLATIPCVSPAVTNVLEDLSPGGFPSGAPTPELVALFLEFDLKERLSLRTTLASDAPLVANGLVEVDRGRDARPDDFMGDSIHLTPTTLAVVTGLPVEVCAPQAKTPTDEG